MLGSKYITGRFFPLTSSLSFLCRNSAVMRDSVTVLPSVSILSAGGSFSVQHELNLHLICDGLVYVGLPQKKPTEVEIAEAKS